MISLKRKIAEERLEILRMLFFKNELKTSKKAFTSEKRETLITFYQTNPALWNHGMIEYRDRKIRRVLIQKLCEKFLEKFTEDDKKSECSFNTL